jgi:multiple sugar transport system substrate-binding protein
MAKRVLARRASIDRRAFLKGAVAATGAAALGGIPGILSAGQAPGYPKGTKLHQLQWINYVPPADNVFLAQAEEFGKLMGVEVQVERIGQNDVRTRATAAIEAKAGPDIILIHNNLPHLFADGLADASDIAEAIGKEQGGYYDLMRANAYSGRRWLAVPHFCHAWAWNYREDWLKEAGFTKFPETWEEFREVGKKLKAMGRPIGQAFGHSEGDPNNYVYPLVWGFGGYEVEKDSKTVVLDKKGTLEAIKLNNAMWKECFDEGGLSWDDSSNNRAFLAGSLSITGNGPSIYLVSRDKFPEIHRAMNHAAMPKGPAGRFYQIPTLSSAVMKYSKNQKLAKEFIRWYMAKEQYEKWFEAMQTFAIPPTKMWYDHPLWTKDPKLTLFRDVIKDARHVGYAGPSGRKASEALAKFIIVDMFAKSIQGATPEEALKWGTAELKKIYAG